MSAEDCMYCSSKLDFRKLEQYRNGEWPYLTPKKWRMSLPHNKLTKFALLFIWEMFTFFIIACNFRALAIGLYFWTALTDAIIAVNATLVAKVFTEDEKARDTVSVVAYGVGASCGSLFAIWLTKHVFGK